MSDISYTEVHKNYRTGYKRRTVLESLTLSVESGEFYGLLGPNGAGKSTSIKLLLDLIRPDSGSIGIRGLPAHQPQARQPLGYLPENPYFYHYLSGWDTLIFCGRASGMEKKEVKERGAQLFEVLELTEAANRPVRSYSKGQTQRLGLAAALVHDPDILVLDEPMSGLDPLGRHLVATLLGDLKKRGKTIFMSSHILSDIERLCDRVGIVYKTKLCFHGPVHELMQGHADLEAAFLAVVQKREDELA